jgi:acetyl esterase/lipase
MSNIDYQHNIAPSFQSKLIQFAVGLFGMKQRMEKKMITNSFVKDPVKIPVTLLRNFNIQESEQKGRKVWTISPPVNKSDLVILYFHGGAYMGNVCKEHWIFIEKLISKTNSAIVIPDYPLAPEGTYKETYNFIGDLYKRLITNYPTKRIIFMGDSAGGGLAIGFTQQLRNENKKQPSGIIAFSPWLDITLSNPNIRMYEKQDKILSIKGLKSAGQKYAGNTDSKDYRVSPIYGDFAGICRISVFTGTNDLLYSDVYKLKQIMQVQNSDFNYFEYPGMFHDWVMVTGLKESDDVMNKVVDLVGFKNKEVYGEC